jgi:phenylalanine-4-hydroxylase
MEQVIARLPPHLRRYVCDQEYERYTPQDHAVWRFVMKHLVRALSTSAHPVYREGLQKTGIGLDRIPRIEEMNACLSTLGWAAVVVDGYIPPAVFTEFQMRKVLAIARDMRRIDQILYTPAPDIVHESAGHAPFIVDVDYAEYLQRFGEIGLKAISSCADDAVYRAVRQLSEIKQDAAATDDEIEAAQTRLDAALAANDRTSEGARLARLGWWTIEYGLVGTTDDYRIFGAGLLSSLGESRSCLDNMRVPKRALTLEAVLVPYDITRPQPQLFVARSCQHLSQVLETFAAGMCFRRGGAESLRTAIASGTVSTARYGSSGVEVSGVFDRVLTDAVGNPVYIGTHGPTQLAREGRELAGHGVDRHAHGFGAPVGRIQGLPRCLSEYVVDELKQHGIEIGRRVRLDFVWGVTVEGHLMRLLRESGRNLVLSFAECRVTGPDGELLFDPVRGEYDMAVGDAIDSVHGGPADRGRYPEEADAPARRPRPSSSASPEDAVLQSIYADIACDGVDVDALHARLQAHPMDWLARIELLALASGGTADALQSELRRIADAKPATAPLIRMGLTRAVGARDRGR